MAGENEIVVDETMEDPKAPAAVAADVDEASEEKILPRGCERNADGSVTVKLGFGQVVKIKSGAGVIREERYDELTFYRLTGADLNAVRSTAPEHQQLVLFTRSTRIRSAVMSALYPRLDASDIMRCGKVLDTFL